MASRSQTRVRLMDAIVKAIQGGIDRQQLSISELSRRSGVHRVYIHRILSGHQVPSLKVAEKILDALGIEIVLEESKA